MNTLYYHRSSYVSHRQAGNMNLLALAAAGIPLTDNPQAAETVILHDDPVLYEELLARHPYWAKIRKIAYAVWETESLPSAYIPILQNMDEIWTCSSFSQQALAQCGRPVHIVPHVVNPPQPSQSDLDAMARLIAVPPQSAPSTSQHSHKPFYFYTIADSFNPRKNVMGLLSIFARHLSRHPSSYLVIKHYRKPLDLATLPHVINIDAELSDGEIAALHNLCHCYLSAHHSEAWGLSLSDAMAHGKAVIATGYSGNMDFMNEDNSFPVRYSLQAVPQLMCQILPLFTPQMHWAEPDPDHMAYLMHKVQSRYPWEQITKKARQDMRAYSAEAVGRVMLEVLEEGMKRKA